MKMRLCCILVFLLLGVGVAFGNVEATGEGATHEQALTSALRHAVEASMGFSLESSSTVINSQLTEDKILAHSSGYVTSYVILKQSATGEGHSVTISANVDGKLLKEDLDSLNALKRSAGNPRILVAFDKKGAAAKPLRDQEVLDDIYQGLVESLTDQQFRVVDKASAEKFSQQVASTHGIDVDTNKAAAFGQKYNAEYTLLYSVGGEVKEGLVNIAVTLRLKAQLIDNTRSQIITGKTIEQSGNGPSLEKALGQAAREAGNKLVTFMVPTVRKNWMDAQQNGQLYTLVIDGVDASEEIGAFTGRLERFPLVNEAREVESGGGKTTFEATYRGKRDQLDRDLLRAAKELGWNLVKVRAEGARSTWKRQ